MSESLNPDNEVYSHLRNQQTHQIRQNQVKSIENFKKEERTLKVKHLKTKTQTINLSQDFCSNIQNSKFDSIQSRNIKNLISPKNRKIIQQVVKLKQITSPQQNSPKFSFQLDQDKQNDRKQSLEVTKNKSQIQKQINSFSKLQKNDENEIERKNTQKHNKRYSQLSQLQKSVETLNQKNSKNWESGYDLKIHRRKIQTDPCLFWFFELEEQNWNYLNQENSTNKLEQNNKTSSNSDNIIHEQAEIKKNKNSIKNKQNQLFSPQNPLTVLNSNSLKNSFYNFQIFQNQPLINFQQSDIQESSNIKLQQSEQETSIKSTFSKRKQKKLLADSLLIDEKSKLQQLQNEMNSQSLYSLKLQQNKDTDYTSLSQKFDLEKLTQLYKSQAKSESGEIQSNSLINIIPSEMSILNHESKSKSRSKLNKVINRKNKLEQEKSNETLFPKACSQKLIKRQFKKTEENKYKNNMFESYLQNSDVFVKQIQNLEENKLQKQDLQQQQEKLFQGTFFQQSDIQQANTINKEKDSQSQDLIQDCQKQKYQSHLSSNEDLLNDIDLQYSLKLCQQSVLMQQKTLQHHQKLAVQ